jgi:hypothetical protein
MITDLQHHCAQSMTERRHELEALKEPPGGLREIAGLFRKTVLLPGEFVPPGLPVESMLDDIVDVEFKRM